MTDINKFLEEVWGKQSVNQKKIIVKVFKTSKPCPYSRILDLSRCKLRARLNSISISHLLKSWRFRSILNKNLQRVKHNNSLKTKAIERYFGTKQFNTSCQSVPGQDNVVPITYELCIKISGKVGNISKQGFEMQLEEIWLRLRCILKIKLKKKIPCGWIWWGSNSKLFLRGDDVYRLNTRKYKGKKENQPQSPECAFLWRKNLQQK